MSKARIYLQVIYLPKVPSKQKNAKATYSALLRPHLAAGSHPCANHLGNDCQERLSISSVQSLWNVQRLSIWYITLSPRPVVDDRGKALLSSAAYIKTAPNGLFPIPYLQVKDQ